WRRGPESDLLDILLPESDDYKLVFINSDSSSKEETSSKEEDDNDSSSTASSFPIDECDWDYFEPGSGRPPPVLNWSSPFGSPRVYRRGVIESPIGSPLVYRRRIRESDTGTDEDIAHLESGSPASSDSIYQSRIIGGTEESFDQHRNEKVMEDAAALQCLHADDAASQRPPCHNCGAPTQYIPIPVPVPIPFPVPTLWTPQDTLLLYGGGEQNPGPRLRVLPRNLWPYLTQAALIWPSVNAGEFGPLHSVLHNNIGDCGANTGATMPVATDHDSQLACAGTSDTEPGGNNKDNDAPEDENDHPAVIGEREELTGYLECENRYVSSSDTSRDSSDSSDTSENENSKPRVRRVYNVNGGEGRQSDDALPSSNVTSDGDDEDGRLSHSSVREDMSSSGSEDTDSDDTGTVADQKPKRFSRIFVVNKNLSSSSNESSRSSDTESSDNDTDTEMDCTVILTHMKPLDENDCANHVFDVNKDTVALNADKDDTNQIQGCDNETSDKNNEKLSEEVRVESRHIETPANVKESEYISSSPGLSDVSAESLNSSDVDEARMDAIAEEESPFLSEAAKQDDHCATISEWNEIRSSGPVSVEGESQNTRDHEGVSAGAIVSTESLAHHAARYTSLVMITQESAPNYQQVSVVTSDTTTLVPDNDVIVRHTNWQADAKRNSGGKLNDNQNQGESVTVITGGETLSAFEEGLADDDSWVENLSHEDDEDEFATNSPTDDSSSGEEVTLTCSAAIDHEEDLRGYHRTAIDFTLHTIVEESCEESEVEQNAAKKKERPASATDLEKYFFFGLGDGTIPSLSSNREDAFSETSSIYSEGMESLGGEDTLQQSDNSDPAELASSRLEKYFLSGFMGFTAERRDSDGSVGSDSEGRPSPEQRRKRLVRARGTGRSHSSSLDNLDNAGNEQIAETQINSENSSSSDSDSNEEINSFEKSDGQFDTVKRKKCKKHKNSTSPAEETRNLETTQEVDEKGTESDEDGHKTPQPEIATPSNLTTTKNQQSRDSGFIGSCDDLLREQRDNSTPELIPPGKSDLKIDLEDITEEKKVEVEDKIVPTSTPPATSLTRKDSFNNWSSDEETNLMMSKMRQFFKTMVANSQLSSSSKPSTPNLSSRMSPKPLPSPRAKNRSKPPQLIYFENELTRLMKTVPGIREDQVREIVEYLSSEDTWSDSYDSSDYTSSDLEVTTSKSVLQQQISDSCKQIINKFDTSVDDEGDEGDGGIIDESHGLNKETAFVYQKLVASFEKMATGDDDKTVPNLAPHSSPPLIAKVMHHIGSRLVALMHEVSSGESHKSNSPKTKHYHRRLQHKLSSASSTTTEDDCPEGGADHFGGFEDNLTPYNLLPRSRSHDLLVSEARTLHQSSGGVSDIVEEREASDCERFSWRGSFESALLATDSRNKLSLLGGEASASALAIAAKRRSAGDLLFSHKSLSREQLDRVRSCGSIGGANSEDKLWVASAIRPNRRRSSVPDASCGSGGSADGEDEDEEMESRSTLPRSLQSGTPTTNSLPRLPTNASSNIMQKSQSMHQFLPQNVKSARYRPPGFSRLTTVPKRAVSAPGLQPSHQRRGRRSQQNVPSDEASISEAQSSPMLATRNGSKSATPSPVAPSSRRNTGSSGNDWHNDEDIDRLVRLHGRTSLSTLGMRSDSMASVYSGAGEGRYGTVTVRGQVEFGLQYNYKAGALEIQIKQCKDLAPVDVKRNRSDPYVKVYLLPDKSKSGKRKTKVKKHTLNPVFDECLKFHIPLNGLESRTLWLTVWHSDMFGRNDFLGEVMMTLENKVFDDPTPKWYNLQERTEPFEDFQSYKGDIIVCLKFVPPDMTVQKKGKRSRGALHVLVKEAKSLAAVKANGTSDPFCKSYLLPDKGRSSKQKTPIARRTIHPVWNYTFVYDDVTLQELAERCLELTVWDHDRLASNEFLGGVRFSLGTGKHFGKTVEWMDATGRELSLWKNMLEKPNFWVEGCLSLRSSLDTRVS
ncbi:Synaptotagmin-like protein 4, partial [Gonioctena quinquepunctata]